MFILVFFLFFVCKHENRPKTVWNRFTSCNLAQIVGSGYVPAMSKLLNIWFLSSFSCLYSLNIYLSIYLSSIYLSIYLFIYLLSIYLLSVYIFFFYLSIYLSSVYVSRLGIMKAGPSPPQCSLSTLLLNLHQVCNF